MESFQKLRLIIQGGKEETCEIWTAAKAIRLQLRIEEIRETIAESYAWKESMRIRATIRTSLIQTGQDVFVDYAVLGL